MISPDMNKLASLVKTIEWRSLPARIISLEWKRLMLRIISHGWKRPLFLVFLIISMFHIFLTVTQPEYSGLRLKQPAGSNTIMPSEDRQLTELRKLKEMPGFESLGLDPEDLYVRSEKKRIMNPLIKYLLEYSPGQLEYSIISSIIKVEIYDNLILNYYIYVSVFILLSMTVLSRTGHSWVVMPVAKAGLNTGWFVIFTTVFLTPILWFIFDYNLPGRMNGIFMQGPLYLFSSSALSLKMYDYYSPVLNRLLVPFTCLTVSASIVCLF